MSNSILKPQNRLSIQSRKQHNILEGLIGLVNRSLSSMLKRQSKLKLIAKEHFDVYIRLQAEEFLPNQEKMVSIAEDLGCRIFKALQLSKNYEQYASEELIQQFIDEIDIMNYMDFEVTKKYFSFIHEYHQPKVIQLEPMAA